MFDNPSSGYETKKMNPNPNSNPRAEIDTSPPIGWVKDAVTRFGGRGSWIPLHILRLAAAADHHGGEEFDMDKVEKQATELEKDLIVKEQETREVLKELEAAKRNVEGLKLNLIKEVSSTVLMSNLNLTSDSHMCIPHTEKPPKVILMELNEARLRLNKTTSDLSVIQTTVETLSNKLRRSRNMMLEKRGAAEISNSKGVLSSVEETAARDNKLLQTTAYNDVETTKRVVDNSIQVQFDFEAEQFKKMEEAASYEVMKATCEIEQTKTSIKMVEMRLTAAKKIEEAARAMEAVAALANRNSTTSEKTSSSSSSSDHHRVIIRHHHHHLKPEPDGITLSYEDDYSSSLTQKAKKNREFPKNKDATIASVSTTMYHNRVKNKPNLSKLAITAASTSTTEEEDEGDGEGGGGGGGGEDEEEEEEEEEDVENCNKKSLEEEGLDLDGTNTRKQEVFYRGRSSSEHHSAIRSSYSTAAKFRYRNSHSYHHTDQLLLDGKASSNLINDKQIPILRSTISIGDILSKKLIIPQDEDIHSSTINRRHEMSLSQMLRDQSGLLLHPPKAAKSAVAGVEKHFFAQRKKFGFIRAASPPLTKQGKKRYWF